MEAYHNYHYLQSGWYKNQKINEAYNQRKALELAKIAGIIEIYLNEKLSWNPLKDQEEVDEKRARLKEQIEINYAYDVVNVGDPKDPMLLRFRKIVEERKEQTKKGLSQLRSLQIKDGLRNVLVGTAGITITIPVGLLATFDILATYYLNN